MLKLHIKTFILSAKLVDSLFNFKVTLKFNILSPKASKNQKSSLSINNRSFKSSIKTSFSTIMFVTFKVTALFTNQNNPQH